MSVALIVLCALVGVTPHALKFICGTGALLGRETSAAIVRLRCLLCCLVGAG